MAPEEGGSVCLDAVASDKEVDVPNVVGLQDNGYGRRCCVEPFPDFARLCGRGDRVEHSHLATGLDDGGGDRRFPAGVGIPVRMLDAPNPEPRRDVDRLVHSDGLGDRLDVRSELSVE